MGFPFRLIIQNALKYSELIFYRYPKANLDIKTELSRKIVIFLYSSHGDIALLSSLTQYIKKTAPKSEITLITSKKCKYVASLNPDIDRIRCVDFPRFWSYRNVEHVRKNLRYDVFLNASFYPNLRYLIPFMPLVEVPFFLFRQKPANLPTPHLELDFKVQKTREPYVVLNLEAGTLGWHRNMLRPEEMDSMKREIIKRNPQIIFYLNESVKNTNSVSGENAKIFRGNVKNLLKLMANSSGIVSLRNGFCDVLAASTIVPQFVIYPEGKFPNEDGIETVKWGSMNTLGYDASITETTVNRYDQKTIRKTVKNIQSFLNNLRKNIR